MPAYVLDCSVAVAWFFADEASTESDALRDLAMEQGAVVPSLWYLEIANVFLQAEKRNRIKAEDTALHLDFIKTLSLESDDMAAFRLRDMTLLARLHHLTSYDTAYLDLAWRRGLPLASRDKDLRNAALQQGVKVLPE